MKLLVGSGLSNKRTRAPHTARRSVRLRMMSTRVSPDVDQVDDCEAIDAATAVPVLSGDISIERHVNCNPMKPHGASKRLCDWPNSEDA